MISITLEFTSSVIRRVERDCRQLLRQVFNQEQDNNLTSDPGVVITGTCNFSKVAENSILGNIAFNVSASLTQVLRWAYWWNSTESLPDDITNEHVLIELNTDFSTKGLASQDIQAIVAAWQAGAISRDTLTELFRRGEVLPEGRTTEEEEALIRPPPCM